MIGSKAITWDVKEFLKGVSTSADVADGGFSPETDAVNLSAVPGAIYQPAAPSDISTNVLDSLIASTEDYQTVAANNRYFVDKSGNYYSFNGTSMSNPVNDNTGAYVDGKTDMAATALGFLTTTATDITLWDGSASLTKTWWTVTKGQSSLNTNVPHPIHKFQKSAWVGDGNKLHKIDESGTISNAFLTLESTDCILSFTTEPGSGYMLISTTSGQNLSDTLPRTNKVHYFDGFSNKPVKTVIVEDMITAFIINGGSVLAFYGQNFGEFNGSGLRFLRKLANVALSNSPSGSSGGLVWKNRVTLVGNNIFYADGITLMCFGNVLGGSKPIFYPAYANNATGNAISLVANIGGSSSKLLGIACATAKFYKWDPASVSGGNGQTLKSNKMQFDNSVWVRSIEVFWDNGLANNAQPVNNVSFYTETGIVTGPNFTLTNTSGGAEYSHIVRGVNIRCRTLQWALPFIGGASPTGNPGVRKIIVRVDPSQLP